MASVISSFYPLVEKDENLGGVSIYTAAFVVGDFLGFRSINNLINLTCFPSYPFPAVFSEVQGRRDGYGCPNRLAVVLVRFADAAIPKPLRRFLSI
ncbi:Hypothetical protein NTJ_10037 [Nesidiocoris tenuis]|uniref:Major facilitator superfamily (MFS) profile domain-containing protein n=1 Tax=Nesidiocoris tenuis TaxID=355587 RepID=A0ABN7AYZ7_9HEMI|nr:Hypothetical protein NTJ_10037 [Nesidiocoris tenuis]